MSDGELRLCTDHAKELKEALENRGLGAFMTVDPKVVAAKIQASHAAKRVTRDSFEPMTQAQVSMIATTIQVVGKGDAPQSMLEGCPVCHLLNDCPCGGGETCHARHWIKVAADQQLELAKELQLLGVA